MVHDERHCPKNPPHLPPPPCKKETKTLPSSGERKQGDEDLNDRRIEAVHFPLQAQEGTPVNCGGHRPLPGGRPREEGRSTE